MQGPPATDSLSVRRAWQLLRLRRPELALRLTDQLLARDPASALAFMARADALRQLKRLPEAVEAARQAVALAPRAAGAFAALARAYGQQGELYEAELAITEALRLEPAAAYYGLLAELQYLLRRPHEASASAKRGLFLDARHGNCLLWLALAQEELNQPAAADEAFGRLLRVAPTSDLAHAKLGQLLLRRYEPAAADYHLTEALRQAPDRAPELLPLLRQARRQRHWPTWLLRSERQRRARQALGIAAPGLRELANRLRATGAVARAYWRTRHDPLVQLPRRQVWERRRMVWLFGFLLLPVLILGGDYLEFFDASTPLSIPQMVGLLIGGLLFQLVLWLLKRKINSFET